MRKTHSAWMAMVLVATGAGCNGDNGDGAVACLADFDCTVELCSGATADSEGTCTEALPGDERDFGQVSLDFSTGDETYLVSVFAPPTGAEAASSDFVAFSLSAGGSPAGALRVADQRPHADISPYWRDRIALEGKRHAGIQQLAADLRAGETVLPRRLTRDLACGGCGATEMCWQGSCETQVDVTFFDGTLVRADVVDVVGTDVQVTVLLDINDSAASVEASAAAEAFAASALEVLSAHGLTGGHAGPLDRDEDGRVAVVFTDRIQGIGGGNIAGFFEFNDFLPTGTGNATGNESDILWSRVPTRESSDCPAVDGCAMSVVTHEVAVGTLVHEYTHLINYAVRVYDAGTAAQAEVLWLDEGVAHLMEDLTGWGPSNIGTVEAAFLDWPSFGFAGPFDSPEQRGQTYSMLRHFVDQNAKAGGGVMDASDVSATLPGILLAEEEVGWLHPTLQSLGAESVWHWLVGAYATGNVDVDPAVSPAGAYAYLEVGSHGDTFQDIGLDPFGSYVDARGRDVSLDGPMTEDLFDLSVPYDSDVVVSGSLLLLVSGLDVGTTTLTGRGAAEVDLQLRALRVN